MSFADFVLHFRSVNVCMLGPRSPAPAPGPAPSVAAAAPAPARWCEARRKGYFTYEHATAGVTTPMYSLVVTDPMAPLEGFVSIHQEDKRVKTAKVRGRGREGEEADSGISSNPLSLSLSLSISLFLSL